MRLLLGFTLVNRAKLPVSELLFGCGPGFGRFAEIRNHLHHIVIYIGRVAGINFYCAVFGQRHQKNATLDLIPYFRLPARLWEMVLLGWFIEVIRGWKGNRN